MNSILNEILSKISQQSDVIASFHVSSQVKSESGLCVNFKHLHEKNFVCVFDVSISGDRLLVCQTLSVADMQAINFFKVKSVNLDFFADRIGDLKKELFLISLLDDQI